MAASSASQNQTTSTPTKHARLSDPRIDAPGRASLWQLVRQSVTAWSEDYASSMGAALAYYTLFSLAPLLLLVISIAGVVFGADAARGQVVTQLAGLIGQEGNLRQSA